VPKPRPAALREIWRGEAPDELHFIDEEGYVTIAHAHGLNVEEQIRTRERLLWLLRWHDEH